jgi:uncharacterized protein (TIGR02118 family)
MITVTVLYRKTDGLKFNMNYYLDSHIPLIRKLLGPALKGATVLHGVSGGAPGSKPEFEVITQLAFESLDAYQTAFGPHAPAVMADLANFCSEPPSIQVCDVRVG